MIISSAQFDYGRDLARLQGRVHASVCRNTRCSQPAYLFSLALAVAAQTAGVVQCACSEEDRLFARRTKWCTCASKRHADHGAVHTSDRKQTGGTKRPGRAAGACLTVGGRTRHAPDVALGALPRGEPELRELAVEGGDGDGGVAAAERLLQRGRVERSCRGLRLRLTVPVGRHTSTVAGLPAGSGNLVPAAVAPQDMGRRRRVVNSTAAFQQDTVAPWHIWPSWPGAWASGGSSSDGPCCA